MFISNSGLKAPQGISMSPEMTGDAAIGGQHGHGESARLLFDSRLAPAPVGLRNVPLGPHKLLYASSQYLIDLRVDRSAQLRHTIIVGQVTASGEPVGIDSATVLIFRERDMVAKAQTNRQGEFHLEFDDFEEDLSIAIGFEQRGTVITIDGLASVQS